MTDVKREYKECRILTYENTTDGIVETSTSCIHGWEYAAPVDQSFVTEWNFVCEDEELAELTQVLYPVGMMIGTFVFPTLSDRFGRKPVMVISNVFVFGVSLALSFSGNYTVFIILRLFTGFFQQGVLTGTTLSLETLPTEIRHYCEISALLAWTTFGCLLSPIAYALRNYPWKYLQMTYALCGAWALIQWWICDSFVYFGIYMISSDLYGDRYINFFLSFLVEYPACLIEYFCLARIGRKWTAIMGHLIAAVGLAVATALTYTADGNTSMLAAATAFTLIGKLGVSLSYSVMYLTTPELYPTNMRSIGLGVCSFMETLGSMIAPFSRNVSSRIKWLPACVYAILCLLSVVLFAFVPETCGVELPTTIDGLKEWYLGNKFELKVGKNRHVDQEQSAS